MIDNRELITKGDYGGV